VRAFIRNGVYRLEARYNNAGEYNIKAYWEERLVAREVNRDSKGNNKCTMLSKIKTTGED